MFCNNDILKTQRNLSAKADVETRLEMIFKYYNTNRIYMDMNGSVWVHNFFTSQGKSSKHKRGLDTIF